MVWRSINKDGGTVMTKPCDKCGYNPDNLTEYMKTVIPKSKIEARIKELESYWVIERNNYPEWVKQKREELKGLLPVDKQ